jgi:tRNA(fMet)-specific endonuclease VapC
LHAGFEKGTRRKENRRQLREFLDIPGVEAISISADMAERYGILVNQLSCAGTPIPTNDVWIAAAALDTGARLVSYDSHFKNVQGLILLSP